MTDHQHSDADALQEELTAYLDGELDAESVSQVEQRLARDAGYREELARLERAWGLLDRLPRAALDETFTKSTIEMVAVAASQEADAVLAEQPRRRRRQQWAGTAGVLAALAVGFFIGTRVWPDPNQELLRDLPVLQNFELYYQADNMDFLRMLDEADLFPEGDADHAG